MIEKWRKMERKETGGRHEKHRSVCVCVEGEEIRPRRQELKTRSEVNLKKINEIDRTAAKDEGARDGRMEAE